MPSIMTDTQPNSCNTLERKYSTIPYVHHSGFDDPESVHEILEAIVVPNQDGNASTLRSNDYLLPSRPIPDQRTEELLFLRMNLLLFLANRRLKSGAAMGDTSVRRLEKEAQSIRGYIVEANQRLVIAMSSKFRESGVPFADLISEGNIALLKAVNLFDVSLGYRFSTYTSHAILRSVSRIVKQEKRRQLASSECFDLTHEDAFPEWLDIHPTEVIAAFMRGLTRREHSIICDRFGMNSEGRSMTLREIGEQLGISKERVRQVIKSACDRGREKFGPKFGILPGVKSLQT